MTYRLGDVVTYRHSVKRRATGRMTVQAADVRGGFVRVTYRGPLSGRPVRVDVWPSEIELAV